MNISSDNLDLVKKKSWLVKKINPQKNLANLLKDLIFLGILKHSATPFCFLSGFFFPLKVTGYAHMLFTNSPLLKMPFKPIF